MPDKFTPPDVISAEDDAQFTAPDAKFTPPDVINLEDENNDTRAVYLSDKDELYNYPAHYDEDQLNAAAQTQVYGRDKNDFFMNVDMAGQAVGAAFNAGTDLAREGKNAPVARWADNAVRGALAATISIGTRTPAGMLMKEGDTAEDFVPMPSDATAALAGQPFPAIWRAVKAVAARGTTLDEDMAKDGRELRDWSNKILNEKFFQPTQGTGDELAFNLGGAGASILTSIALAALTRGSGASALLFSKIASSDTYIKGIEAGKSPRESFIAAEQNAASEGLLEYAGLEILTKHLAGRQVFTRWAVKASSEFVQEFGQNFSSDVIAKTNGFSSKGWGDVFKDAAYSGMIGFITGGVAGIGLMIRENNSVIGKMHELGMTDAEIDSFVEVMETKHTADFKTMMRSAAREELEKLKEYKVEEGDKHIVVDENGLPVVLGMSELSEEEKFRYRSKDIERLGVSDTYDRARLGELPAATERPKADIKVQSEDPVVQARMNQIQVELEALYAQKDELELANETTPLTKVQLRQYKNLDSQIAELETEQIEAGWEWTDTPVTETSGKGKAPQDFKTAEEYVASHSLYHGTPAEIEGGKLKFGSGKQLKKGGYMGGHFLTDKIEAAQAFQFGGQIYYASGDIKNKVFDVNKNKKMFKDFIGEKYKNQDGQMETFTKNYYDFMFPDGENADWSTVYTDVVEHLVKPKGFIGMKIKEYAGGVDANTYQLWEDEIPVKTKSQLTSEWEKAQGDRPSGQQLTPKQIDGNKVVRSTAREMYQAKIDELKLAVSQFNEGFKSGKEVTEANLKSFSGKLIELIEMSDILTDRQKVQKLETVAKVMTENSFKKRVEQLGQQIKELEVKNLTKLYTREIERLLQKAKKNKRFDANTRTIFDELIALNKEDFLDPEKYQEAYDGTMEAKLRFDIAQFSSPLVSLKELQQIWTDLKSTYESGVDARTRELKEQRKEDEKKIKEANADISRGGKKATLSSKKEAEQGGREIIPLRRLHLLGQRMLGGVINAISHGDTRLTAKNFFPSGKGAKAGETFLEKLIDPFKAFRTKNKVTVVFQQEIKQAIKDIWGIEVDSKVAELIAEHATEVYEIPYIHGAKEEIIDEKTGIVAQEAAPGEKKILKITRAQARKRVMEWQRAVGQKTLTEKDGYTQELMDKINGLLTAEDYAFIRYQYTVYDELYDMANPIYRKLQGQNLPYDDFYSHLFTYGGKPGESGASESILNGDAIGMFGDSINQKSILKRATGTSLGLKQVDDIFALYTYVNDMAHYIGYAQLATDMDKVLLHPDTAANIEANYGKETVDYLRKEAERMARATKHHRVEAGMKWVDNAMGATARFYLANPNIGVKQLSSQFLYAAEVPPLYFGRYYADMYNPVAWANGKNAEVFRQLSGNVMMQGRGDTFVREIKAQVDHIQNARGMLAVDERHKFAHFMLGAMLMGDRGAIYMGGYAMYRYDTEVKKMTHEQAIEHFERFTNETQQSPDPFQLSPLLANPNPIVRLTTIFTQFPSQLLNSEMKILANWQTVPLSESARKLFVYHVLIPTLCQLVANRFKWDKVDQTAAVILGPLNAIYIVGDLFLENVVRSVVGLAFNEKNTLTFRGGSLFDSTDKAINSLVKEFHKVAKNGGVTTEQFFDIVDELLTATAPVTGAIGGAAKYASNMGKAGGQFVQQDYWDTLWKFLGYSDWQVDEGENKGGARSVPRI